MASTKDPYAQGTRPSVQTETNVTVSITIFPYYLSMYFEKKNRGSYTEPEAPISYSMPEFPLLILQAKVMHPSA